MKAKQMMDKNFIYGTVNDFINDVSKIMEDHKVFTYPILDSDMKLVGWVTSLDITRGLREDKDIVSEVDRFMDKAVVTIKGYDSRDSIGKFIVQGNPFYDECSKISHWIANCYTTCFAIQAAVTAGEREIPTIQEVVDSLPTPDFLTEEELDVLTAPAVDMMNGGMM